MKKYVVYLEEENGAKTAIDNITGYEAPTPEQYRKDCEANGCEWPEGEITFEEVIEQHDVIWWLDNKRNELTEKAQRMIETSDQFAIKDFGTFDSAQAVNEFADEILG